MSHPTAATAPRARSAVDRALRLLAAFGAVLALVLAAAPGPAGAADPAHALRFNGNTNGSGSYVQVPNSGNIGALSLGRNFTLEAWVKWDGALGYRAILSKPRADQPGSAGTGYALVVADGRPMLAISASSVRQNRVAGPAAQLPVGQWAHVAATYDGRVTRVYVEGALRSTQDWGSFADADRGSTHFLIGREFVHGLVDRVFGGTIDRARAWNLVRTDAQVAATYDRELTGAESGLVGYWRFDEGSGTTTADASASGNHGTLFNNAAWTTDIAPLADTTPPVVTHQVAGTLGQNGWYVSDVTVSWSTADADSPVTATSGCGAQTLAADTAGMTITCSATSAGGTGTNSVTIKRDATAPTVTYSGNAGGYTVDQTITITCAPADALSGVASTTCQDVTGPAYDFPLGTNSYAATATDAAGNVGGGSTSFTVAVTPGALEDVVATLVPDGGTANSLTSKLDGIQTATGGAREGKVQAFVHQVNAQTGKKISPENAARLIKLASGL